jgi:glycosyltransferase involved in cell wall biosynthesis
MKRLLLVSFHFPPFNAIAAVRTGKFARFLLAHGWDVRVIAARSEAPETLPLEIPAALVLHTSWTNVDAVLDRLLRLDRRRANEAPSGSAPAQAGGGLRRRLGALRSALFHVPDNRVAWLPEALSRAQPFLGDWRPDVVYASAPPATTLLVARSLAHRYGVPWIAEFRDLWIDNPYYEFPAWRRRLETPWERRVVGDAAALVTVSSIWRDLLRAKFGKPVALAMNGFAPEDMPPDLPAPAATGGSLRILYTGMIYPGYRDPRPLFEAIARLGAARDAVEVEFAGAGLAAVMGLAAAAGVADRVRIVPPVAYREALRLQSRADILLHLQWNDPRESGTISGKLFEYLGARRPVLGLGYDRGEVAALLAEHGRGVVLNEPGAIAAQLSRWIAEKRAGGIAPLAEDAVSGLTRDAQFVAAERLAWEAAARTIPAPSPAARRDPTGMRATRLHAPAPMDAGARPLLCVVVDTEEQFDWQGPFSRHNVAVSAIGSLHLAQSLFERFGISPAYLLDYPIATADLARGLIGDWHAAGRCEIGAQLHPWVNPPHVEEVTIANSFAGNLPPGLERQKLEALKAEIAAAFGDAPRIYKAGRYGLGPSTATTLERLGFAVDTSGLPYTDLRFKQGPDLRSFTERPFLFGERRPLLQLPPTRGFIGRAARMATRCFPLVEGETVLASQLRGALARTGLIDRVTLTPEGIALDQMKALTRALLARGQRIFVMSFHSPSLEPGHTPYVVDRRTRAAFLGRIEGYLEFFMGELGGGPTTPLALHALLLRARRAAAGPASIPGPKIAA